MDALDRTIHQMLRRREAGQIIRSYGVAAFGRQVRCYVSTAGRDADERIYRREPPSISGLMAEALATAFY